MRKIISTDKAPAAVGPYSQAVKFGDFLFTSGQIPLDPATGALVSESFDAQAEQVFKNMLEVLAAGGASMNDVVKSTVFLIDLANFARFNEIYARYFTSDPPARSCVQVSALPKGALVEMECVACIKG